MISVIIPAYNCSDCISEALDSVRMQSRFDLIEEVIVVNDGSTDQTLEILHSYMKKYPTFPMTVINQSNKGVSAARNNGILKSTADWIALLDSDDYWLKRKIETQVDIIRKRPDILFIGTGRNNEELQFGTKVDDNLYSLSLKQLLVKNWPHTSTVLIKRSIFFDVGLFDENRKYMEDAQLWLKIAAKYPLYYISSSYEIAGKNKLSFGSKGLSANLHEMHKGCLKNIDEVYKENKINFFEMFFLKFFEYIKYIRRIIISKLGN